MKRKLLFVFGGVVLVLAIAGTLIGIYFARMAEESELAFQQLEIHPIDLTLVKDGTYEGEHRIFPIYAKVRVVVVDHRIESIELLKHESGPGYGADLIVEDVIQAQSMDVPLLSGATSSSKIVLKAIENALTKGLE